MRLGRTREDEFEINVISLIDVMLTLLMFFVMTTTFVQHSAMKVALPKASETQQEVRQDALVIMIGSDSRFYVDNNEVLNPNVDSLKQAITHVAGDDHDRPVILRADGMTPHQAVVTAMDALGQLGFTHMSIATVHGKGSENQ
ncbi:MAG TPA: biopolymer transporter ExbD [Rudaea sp.]|nr:biopolymer transporter ExbD [Rudaea sp.]